MPSVCLHGALVNMARRGSFQQYIINVISSHSRSSSSLTSLTRSSSCSDVGERDVSKNRVNLRNKGQCQRSFDAAKRSHSKKTSKSPSSSSSSKKSSSTSSSTSSSEGSSSSSSTCAVDFRPQRNHGFARDSTILITGGHRRQFTYGRFAGRPTSAPTSRERGGSLSLSRNPRRAGVTSRNRQSSRNENQSLKGRNSKRMYMVISEEIQRSPPLKGSQRRERTQRRARSGASSKSQQGKTYYLLVSKDVEKVLTGKMIAIVESRHSSKASRKSESLPRKDKKFAKISVWKAGDAEVIDVGESGLCRP